MSSRQRHRPGRFGLIVRFEELSPSQESWSIMQSRLAHVQSQPQSISTHHWSALGSSTLTSRSNFRLICSRYKLLPEQCVEGRSKWEHTSRAEIRCKTRLKPSRAVPNRHDRGFPHKRWFPLHPDASLVFDRSVFTWMFLQQDLPVDNGSRGRMQYRSSAPAAPV